MKKNVLLTAFLLLLTSLLMTTSCSSGESSNDDVVGESEIPSEEEPEVRPVNPVEHPTGQPIVLTETQKEIVNSNNDFAFNLFRAVSQSEEYKGRSCVVSPVSMTYLLGMLNAGATGETAKELQTILGFGDSNAASINALCSQLIKEVPLVDNSITLGIANCLAADQSLSLKEQYKKDMDLFYGAEVVSLPFGTNEAADYVNNWSSRQTHGLIPHLVDGLDGVMALMNAVYLNAPWTEQFTKEKTVNESFFKADGSSVSLPMMNGSMPYSASYAKFDGFEMLRLPYGYFRNWGMYVLLPNTGKTTSDVLATLTNATWTDAVKNLKSNPVKVKLPRFKTESDMPLKTILSEMGAPSMFLPRQEFPLISSNYQDLYVSSVKQKVSINVMEEGTEATAVSIASMETASASEPQFVNFHATRPFIYLIQEASSGAIFFIGMYDGS